MPNLIAPILSGTGGLFKMQINADGQILGALMISFATDNRIFGNDTQTQLQRTRPRNLFSMRETRLPG